MDNVQDLSPLMIMAINMTIVFAVLIALGVLMKLVYWLDPTRLKKTKPAAASAPAASAASAAAAPAASDADEAEVVAVIAAAVMAMGYSEDQIASIRPTASRKWTLEGRLSARM